MTSAILCVSNGGTALPGCRREASLDGREIQTASSTDKGNIPNGNDRLKHLYRNIEFHDGNIINLGGTLLHKRCLNEQ